MAHVELSLSGAFVPQARTPSVPATGVSRWTETVAAASEPCLVIDVTTRILAVSPTASELLGLGQPAEAVGRSLLGGALRLIDFTAQAGELDEPEIEKIPPLLAIRSQKLERGLIRVHSEADGTPLTVDAIATPLLESGQVVASMTFFSAVRY